MACSKELNERSASSLSKKQDYVEVKAVIGCFLIDDKQRVFALVNRHVTRALSGTIYIANKNNGDKFPFGCCVSKKKSCFEQINREDIDLIQVQDGMKLRCKPVNWTSSGKSASSYKLYEGNVKDFYGKTVFMCTNDEERKTALPSRLKTNVQGTVCQLPHGLRESFREDINFMVYGHSDESFADPGDSGRMIAIDVEQNGIELVGIIAHGKYRSLEIGTPITKDFILKEKSTFAVVEDVQLKQKMAENLNPTKDDLRKTIVFEETSGVDEIEVTPAVTTSLSENEMCLANEAANNDVQNGAICLLLKTAICLLEKKYNLTLSVYDGYVHEEETSVGETVESGRMYTFRTYAM